MRWSEPCATRGDTGQRSGCGSGGTNDVGDVSRPIGNDEGVTAPGDPATPPGDPRRDDAAGGDETLSWSPEPEPTANPGVPASSTPGATSWTPQDVDATWAAMERQLRQDEDLARAFTRYDRKAGRVRARQAPPEAWRAPVPVRARKDSNPLTGFITIVIVVVALIVSYDRWGTGKVDPSLAVALSDHAAMPRVTSQQGPPPGFEEQPERLLPAVSTAGLEGSYAFLDTHHDTPVTWSPCRPIHVVVDTAQAPDDFVDWVSHVLAEASELSGLTFVLDGPTTERVSFEREAYQPDRYGGQWAPVIVGFADESEIPELAGRTAGLGGASALEVSGNVGYVTGAVAIDTTMLAYPRYAGEPAYVQVLRHEVGHLLGLDHVDDTAALMHPHDSSQTTWGPGDRAGLAVLGSGECQPTL